jgi:tRNA A22 N-methylase
VKVVRTEKFSVLNSLCITLNKLIIRRDNMSMTQKIDVIFEKSIEEVEKQVRTNFEKHNWEVIHNDILKTNENNTVKTFVGVTSAFGGVTVTSFLTDGGGYIC